jgi:hypothetical protein
MSKKMQRAFRQLGYQYNTKTEKDQALKSETATLQVYLALKKGTGHLFAGKQIKFTSGHTQVLFASLATITIKRREMRKLL